MIETGIAINIKNMFRLEKSLFSQTRYPVKGCLVEDLEEYFEETRSEEGQDPVNLKHFRALYALLVTIWSRVFEGNVSQNIENK